MNLLCKLCLLPYSEIGLKVTSNSSEISRYLSRSCEYFSNVIVLVLENDDVIFNYFFIPQQNMYGAICS